MTPVLAVAFFILGAIIASFIELVVSRLYTGASIFRGRSRCDSCRQTLTALDLVPIVSFALTFGRCRSCASKISLSSTISELLLGSLFALSYLWFGFSHTLLFLCIALAALLGIVRYDLKHTVIPPVFLGIFLLSAAVAGFLLSPGIHAFGVSVLTALAEAAILALITLLSKGRAMGLADAPLVFGLALIAGPMALSGFVFSFWIGAVVGIIILARTPRGSRMGIEVPFAPFLAAGFLLALFTEWNPFSLISALMLRVFGA